MLWLQLDFNRYVLYYLLNVCVFFCKIFTKVYKYCYFMCMGVSVRYKKQNTEYGFTQWCFWCLIFEVEAKRENKCPTISPENRYQHRAIWNHAVFLMACRGRLHWFQKEVWLYVSLWEKDIPSHLIQYLCEQFPNEFTVSIFIFKFSSA